MGSHIMYSRAKTAPQHLASVDLWIQKVEADSEANSEANSESDLITAPTEPQRYNSISTFGSGYQTYEDSGDDSESLKVPENHQNICIPRHIVVFPKFVVRFVWAMLKFPFKASPTKRRNNWYEAWDDSTLPTRRSVQQQGSDRRPPIVIRNQGEPTEIIISMDHPISAQRRFINRFTSLLKNATVIRHDNCGDTASFEQKYYLGPNRAVV